MKNRTVGLVIIGVSALIGLIVFSFNRALTNIVSTVCEHGAICPMWKTLTFQTNISLGIMVVVILVGLFLVFSKEQPAPPTERAEAKETDRQNYEDILKTLKDDEKKVLEKVIEEKGAIFQSELVEKTGLTKVKVTRLLDILEGKGLVERKRRGMTNIVILKHS